MSQNKSILPDELELTYIRVDKRNSKDSKEIQLKATVSNKVEDEQVVLQFDFQLDFIFEFEFGITLFYDEENFDNLDESTIYNSISQNCYPLYAKVILVMTMIMDQLDVLPLVLQFKNFQESFLSAIESKIDNKKKD